MSTVLIVLALALVAGVAAFATGRAGRMADAPPDIEPVDLPDDRLLVSRDVDRTRFAIGLRGYRMDQVDAVLDRLSTDLEQREGYLDDLTAALVAAGIDVPAPPVPLAPLDVSDDDAEADDVDDEPRDDVDDASDEDAVDDAVVVDSDADSDADTDAVSDAVGRPGA